MTSAQADPAAVGATAAGRPAHGALRSPAAVATVLGLAAAVLSAMASWSVSLWSDEAATISAAERSWGDLWLLLGQIDAVHGTYYALMHPWVEWIGVSPFGLRLPSALAVGAAVAGLYLLVRRLADARTALVAGIVLALLPRTTWAGIEARPFALSIALAVWATVALESALRHRGTGRFVVYGVLVGLGTAVNLYVALVALAHLVTVLLGRDRGALARTVGAAVGGGLLSSPVVLTGLGQGGQLGIPGTGLIGRARNVLVDQWFLGETPTPTTASGTTTTDLLSGGELWKPAAVLLAAAVWVLVARALLRGRDRERSVLVAWTVPWLVLPTVVVLAASLVSPTLYNARYFGFCAPALAALVAAGLGGLPRRAGVASGVILVLLAAPVYASQRTVGAKSGSDWALVAHWLDGRTQPGDAVYFGPRDDLVEGVARRSLRTASLAYPAPFSGLVDVTSLASPADGATLFGTSASLTDSLDRLDGHDTLWVLRRQDRRAEATAEDALLAGAGYAVVDVFEGPQTEVLELHLE